MMNVQITGASGGLGRAFAIDCAQRGYDLLLTDINEAGLNTFKQGLLRQYDITVLVFACDLTEDDEVVSLMSYAKDNGFDLDMVFNVAGLDHEGAFTLRTFKQISSILHVNIEATLRMTYQALAMRKQNRRFYIVFVSSLASLYPMPLKATYAASKRFLLDFSIALGQELKPQNVSVLSLCPGGLATTKEALRGIAAQNFWGAATTNKLERVAHRTIAYVLHGRRVYIPGILNRTLSILGKIVPTNMVVRLLYTRWSKAQKQWDA
jgi:hypothetical protein